MSREKVEVLKCLKDARDRIERGWCQYAYALDADGDRVRFSRMSDANSWCALGALYTAADPCETDAGFKCSSLLEDCIGGDERLSEWNDVSDRTQADVLALYDQAIEKLSRDG